MNDKEWIENIQNISNEELFKQLDFIGCDGYYSDLWVAIIEELKRRTKQQDNTGDLISREALKKKLQDVYEEYDGYDANDLMRFAERVDDEIDNAPTVEVPENEVNCVLTMFGKCSYNKTGCSDCEIKEKIRKALYVLELLSKMKKAPTVEERPQGEWISGFKYALDKAFSEFDSNCTYSGDRVLQKLEKLKEGDRQ